MIEKCRKCGREFTGLLYEIAIEGGDPTDRCGCDNDRTGHEKRVEELLEAILGKVSDIEYQNSGRLNP